MSLHNDKLPEWARKKTKLLPNTKQGTTKRNKELKTR